VAKRNHIQLKYNLIQQSDSSTDSSPFLQNKSVPPANCQEKAFDISLGIDLNYN
jgi:hypothetical protein